MFHTAAISQECSFQASFPQIMCTVTFLVPGKAIQKSEDFHWKSYMYAGQQFFFFNYIYFPRIQKR